MPITGIVFKRAGIVCFFPRFLGNLPLEATVLWLRSLSETGRVWLSS